MSELRRDQAHRRVPSAIERAGGTRQHHLWRRYGLTLEDVAELLRLQGGVCAVCLSRDPDHVDHDHQTGRVRGLLCFSCNGGLGQFKDDAVILRRAAEYLDNAATEPLALVVSPRRDRRRRQALQLPLDGDVAS
jgi:hypothetical protein